MRPTRRQKPTVEKANATEAGAGRNLWDTAAMEDFTSRIKEEDEEEGLLVLVVKEEPPDEQSTLSPPDEVKIETVCNVYPHQSDINNDTEYYSNPYDKNGHLVCYVEDGGRTCVQEEHQEYEGANEDYSADQVCSPKTELTEQVKEEIYETHNPDVENFVLEKWLCGPQPDEEQLVKLMMQPPPPLPDPLPYIKCEDSQEFRCIYCAYRNRLESAISQHYRQKHGPRYIYCFACGDTFAQKVNLAKHEAGRCKAASITTVRRVREALYQSERRRQQLSNILRKSQQQQKKVEANPVEDPLACCECGQQFADTTSLQLHQNFRRECRRFHCEFCPSAYTTRNSLNSHRERHLRQRFSCEYCGKEFYKKYSLAMHIRTHGVLVGYPFGGVTYALADKAAPFLIIAFCVLLDILLQLMFLDFTVNERDHEWCATECDERFESASVGGAAGGGVSLWTSLLEDAPTAAALTAIFSSTCAMAVLEPCLPIWLMTNFKPEKWQLGTVFVPDSLGYLVATNALGGTARALGRARVAVCAVTILGLSACTIPAMRSVRALLVPHALLGLALGAADAALVPALAERVAARAAATSALFSLHQTAVSAAYFIAPLLGGEMTHTLGFTWCLRLVGGANLLCAARLYVVFRRHGLDSHLQDNWQHLEDSSSETTGDGGGGGGGERLALTARSTTR